LHDVERLSTSFLLQDLKCPKTKLASQRLGSATSAFSVPLELATCGQAELTDRLRTLRRVADFHNFPLLLETVDGLM
jgi:hypothetical protein